MRVAHFSDLHLLSLDGVRTLQYANKRWIGAMNLLSNRARHYVTEAFVDMVADLNQQPIDHIICTGDVTNLAFRQEFEFARGHFEQLGLGPKQITVLPGNHDAYVAEGIDHFAAVFAPYFTADDGWTWDDGDPSPWPVVRVRDQVAVIGLSTSLATPWFTAYGRLGERQLARLGQALADPRLVGKVRIVAIHHPPAGKRAASIIRGLKDREAFAHVLAQHGAELVIHGHEHRDLRHVLPGPAEAPIPVLGVQSGTYGAHDVTRTARYRVFDIDAGQVRSHHLRVWHRDRKCYELDAGPGPQAVASP